MDGTELEFIVGIPGGIQYRFVFVAHRSASSDARLIEPEFYKNFCPEGKIPQGDHHEIEIIEPHLWDHKHAEQTHYHAVPGTKRKFVCWTGSLPTLKDVQTLLMFWCVGTVYTMITGKDFGPEYARDPDSFKDRMAKEHRIVIRPA